MYLYSRARAVTVNDWSLRILQELGVAERVKEDMDIARSVTWKTHDDHLVLRLVPSQDGLGHPPAMMIYQPEMEPSSGRTPPGTTRSTCVSGTASPA